MIDEIKKVQKVQDNSVWDYRILPFLSVAVGAIVLWSVWFFYHDRWGDSDFPSVPGNPTRSHGNRSSIVLLCFHSLVSSTAFREGLA